MAEEKKSSDPDAPQEIDRDIKEVMDDHTRLVSGRGPNVANEARRTVLTGIFWISLIFSAVPLRRIAAARHT